MTHRYVFRFSLVSGRATIHAAGCRVVAGVRWGRNGVGHTRGHTYLRIEAGSAVEARAVAAVNLAEIRRPAPTVCKCAEGR